MKSRSSLLLKWLLSYFLVLTIPTVLVLYLFTFSLDSLRSQAVYMNQTILEQFRQIVDNYLVIMDSFSSALYEDNDLTYLRNAQSSDRMGGSYDFITSYHNLRTKCGLAFGELALNGSFYIYLSESQMVYYDSSIITAEHYYQFYYPQKKAVTYDDWAEDMTALHNGEISGISDASGEQFLVKKVTLSASGQSYPATMVIMINIQELLDQAIVYNGKDNSSILITDEEGNIILETSTGNAEFIRPLSPGEELHETIQDETVLGISSYYGVNYFSILSDKVLLHQYEKTIYLLLAGIVVSIILSFVFAMIITRRNYLPINQLAKSAESFLEERTAAHGRHFNEFRYIRHALESASEQRHAVTRQLEETQSFLKSVYFRNMLVDRESTASDEKRDFLGPCLSHAFFQVFIITMPFSDVSIREIQESISSDGIENLLLDSLEEKAITADVIAIRMHGSFTILVGIDKEELKGYQENLSAILVSFLDKLHQENLVCGIAAGSLVKDHSQISAGYRQALMSSDYQSCFPEEKITLYSQTKFQTGRSSRFLFDSKEEQRFITLVYNGEFQQASEILNHILDQCFPGSQKRQPLAPQLILNRPAVVDVMCTCIKISESRSSENSSDSFLQISIDHFLRCTNYEELKKELCSMLEQLCAIFQQENTKRRNSELADKIDHIIEKSLSDCNLNVSFVANELDMNANYISFVYRESRGESILNCIMKKRMAAAKEMLGDTEKSVQSISEQLGFTSSNSFIRNFKKWEGITPGQFRKNRQKN